MKELRLYEYGIIESDSVESIVRAGETFKITEGTNKPGYHGYTQFNLFIKPSKEEALEKGLIELISEEEEEDQYAVDIIKEYRYNGEEPVIIECNYGGVNSSFEKYIICIPDDVKIIYEPNYVIKDVLTPPKRLLNKWIKECSIKEKRDPKQWKRYARVERCINRKIFIYSLFEYSKKYKGCPIMGEYLSYYTTSGGTVSSVDVYAIIEDGVLHFVESKESALARLKGYDKIIYVKN